MVARRNVSGRQYEVLFKLARQAEPITARALMVHPSILEGCYRRGFVGRIVDPSGVRMHEVDIRWFLTQKGRRFMETGDYVHEEELYHARKEERLEGVM